MPERNLQAFDRRILAPLRALIRAKYFSFSVQGAEHVPRNGNAIYVCNHSGWIALDTLFAGLAVADHVGLERFPWCAAHDSWYETRLFHGFFETAGGFPASWLRTPERLPSKMQVLAVFPEGTEGNCKSFVHAYQMREWRTGFIRLALARNAAVVPIAIIGGEESLPSLCTIRFVKSAFGTVVPLPLTPLPLPTRWKVVFHKPFHIGKSDLNGYEASTEARNEVFRRIAARTRADLQRTIDRETADRSLARFSRFLSRQLVDRIPRLGKSTS
ncbi:lysophospholipid acyltransferase family protein [Pendulispora albinea]|uniref:1-acyl-sn-glycerol-3-phosphate acyltransferase n=1 Tax=Pendulispora albinea TaxID=2741071 RepID=A0ABZ2LQF2_9BACT